MTACRGCTVKQNIRWRKWSRWRLTASHPCRCGRIIALMGIILFVVFLGRSVWVFATWLAGHTVQGWTSVMLLFLLIASFQTFAIAVIGEYVGKIYFEAKARPRYIVEEEIGIVPAMPESEMSRNRAETARSREIAIRA